MHSHDCYCMLLCIDCHRANRIMIITSSIVYFYTPPLHTNLLAGSNNRSELPSQIIQSINSPPTTYHSEPVAYSPHLLSSVLCHIALAGALPLPSPFACIPPLEHTSIEDVASVGVRCCFDVTYFVRCFFGGRQCRNQIKWKWTTVTVRYYEIIPNFLHIDLCEEGQSIVLSTPLDFYQT